VAGDEAENDEGEDAVASKAPSLGVPPAFYQFTTHSKMNKAETGTHSVLVHSFSTGSKQGQRTNRSRLQF
jgi:hypothetical protein